MKYAVGIDLGGTKIETALVDEKGNKLKSCRVPTEHSKGPEKIAKNIQEAVDKVKKKDIEGIGIGVPGFVYENKIYSNPNVPGLDKALEIFSKNNQCIIENDANCFALAEFAWGAGKETNNMIGLIWGTGIGSGIIIHGKLLRGAIGGTGEVGHTIIDNSIKDYIPGGKGTWENFCSGKHIVRRYLEQGGNKENDRVDKIFSSDDILALKVKEDTLKWMGIGLGNLVTTLNPELIVVGGGVSNLDVYDELNEQMRKFTIEASGEVCKVVKNTLGDSAGVLGAAALILYESYY